MRGNITLLFVLVVILNGILHQANANTKGKTQLIRKLMRNYNKDIIPDGPYGAGINVTHGLALYRIISFKDRVLELDGMVSMSWRDNRLKWNPAIYGHILRFNSQTLWQPDIVLINSADQIKGIDDRNFNMVVASNGDVNFMFPQKFRSYCTPKVYSFGSVCELKFLSWTYDRALLDMLLSDDTVDLQDFDHDFNPRLDVVDGTAERNSTQYPCCPQFYPYVTYNITITY